jgi:hypothetical protein
LIELNQLIKCKNKSGRFSNQVFWVYRLPAF